MTEEQIEQIATKVAQKLEAGSIVVEVAARVAEKLQKHKPKDALTPKELGDYLGISKRSVYRHLSERDFPVPRKIGRLLSFDRKEVDVWLERKSKEGKAVYRSEGKWDRKLNLESSYF